jgi:hypothetical protein
MLGFPSLSVVANNQMEEDFVAMQISVPVAQKC